MQREMGRPKKIEGRLEKELRVYDMLERLNISFERIDHEALLTMEACKEVDQYLDAVICKNLFLCNAKKTQHYLLMIMGNKKFRSSEVASQIQSTRLSFGEEGYMQAYLDITPGAVSVMGLMNDTDQKVKLLIDKDLLKYDYIGCHPCVNTSSIRIKVKELLDKFLNEVNHTPIFVHIEE